MTTVRAMAPGRVNLIGDHTDYTGGLVMPMAIQLSTVVELDLGMPWIELVSANHDEPAFIPLFDAVDPATVTPAWARYVAGVASVLGATEGGVGFVRTDLPIGAGLSSSAALEVAVALALGFEGTSLELAAACQRAEHLATGVPSGIMDQLASAAGVAGHALLIDCHDLEVTPVRLPEEVDVVAIHSGTERTLANSFYGVRRAQAEEAESLLDVPLREAMESDVDEIATEILRRRARHVVTENQRVRDFAGALTAGDLAAAGQLMVDSHASLSGDFDVSTRDLDQLVEHLVSTPGVHGARLTGAGFGGCVVALTEPGVDLDVDLRQWRLEATGGANVEVLRE